MTTDHLTFGVELECYLPRNRSRADLVAALAAAGIAASAESYNHRTRDHWKLVDDSSLGDYTRGVEVVSPVLTGDAAGFAALTAAVQAMDDFGCAVRRTCGFHVHVGAPAAVRVGFFKELIAACSRFEPVLDGLTAPSRRGSNNTYCQPTRYTDAVKAAGNLDQVRRAVGYQQRFRKLNLESFWRHGTVEFRQHQGTVNARKASAWVRLCLGLVAHALKNTEVATVVAADRPRDYDRSPRVPADRLVRGYDLTRDRAYLEVRRVRGAVNPRRPGTRGAANWETVFGRFDRVVVTTSHYWLSVRDYLRNGGGLDHLRWDVEHGFVEVLDRRYAPLADEPEVSAVAVERPDTEGFPVTLDGLLDLVEASETDRAFLTERYLELNA